MLSGGSIETALSNWQRCPGEAVNADPLARVWAPLAKSATQPTQLCRLLQFGDLAGLFAAEGTSWVPEVAGKILVPSLSDEKAWQQIAEMFDLNVGDLILRGVVSELEILFQRDECGTSPVSVPVDPAVRRKLLGESRRQGAVQLRYRLVLAATEGQPPVQRFRELVKELTDGALTAKLLERIVDEMYEPSVRDVKGALARVDETPAELVARRHVAPSANKLAIRNILDRIFGGHKERK